MPLSADDLKRAVASEGLCQFMELVTVACRPEPRPFGQVADPWQREKVLAPLAPAVDYVTGISAIPPRYKALWWTLAKGSDKTSVIARTGHFICNYARRWTGVSVWASDRKQAKLLRDAMLDERRLNPWLPEGYRIDNYRAEGATGFVEINSSDVKGGHGTRSNVYVADEISVWQDPKVWGMIQSSATKYDDTVLVVLCNAGWRHTWQYELRDKFEAEFLAGDTTYFWEPDGIVASWTNRREVEKARSKINASEGRRLYDNVWVDAGADSAFDGELVKRAFRPELAPYHVLLPGFEADDEPLVAAPEVF